jgi:hypothetical protein
MKTTPLHPCNSNLASSQSERHLPAMADFLKELRAIRRRLEKDGVSLSEWADAANVNHTTVWRIMERGQTPSLPTYLALVGAEKKIACAQK